MSIPILTVAIQAEHDVVLVRQRTRQIASLLEIEVNNQTRLATAVSEIARNAYQYAGGGRAEFLIEDEPIPLLQIRISDHGPGIARLDHVLSGDYSSQTGLGLGLAGAKRLVDRFEISSTEQGTVVLLGQKLPKPGLVARPRLAKMLEELERTLPDNPFAEVMLQNQELLRTQHELLRLNQELEAADKAKNHFLAMLGHELRNHLGALRNALTVLTGDYDSLKRVGMRKLAISQATHLSRLVDDLLDISAITNGKIELKRETADLGAEVAQLILEQSREIEAAGILLELSLPRTPVWVQVDRTRLSQIVINLISNALKFTDPGGSLQVTVGGGDLAQVTVADTGCGIEAVDLDTIFEPFIQTFEAARRMTGGLGLGLPIIKALAEVHGGELKAHSPGLGQGTTFRLTLPTVEPPQTVEVQTQHESSSDELRIMIVDDHRPSAFSLAELLRLQGHQVTVVENGPGAIAEVERQAFDLVICDLGLPEMDGFEVARRLLERRPQLRIFALSGFGDPDTKTAALGAGFETHLTKPVDLEELFGLLGEIVVGG